ncbi:fam-a protein [Plasmodium vinckei]|uniref:Fam-a protein n=1 Tax=Plasmodium vinckei TaxID=5860 RepID=A0A6V7TI64_PLAVN|nr:fam-a protein [Plasmodium vinckei]
MNKFYIQIVLFLLSISVCLNSTTLAADPSPNKAPNKAPNEDSDEVPNAFTKLISENPYPTAEEIFEQQIDLLCKEPEETINASKLMDEAVVHLAYHAANKDGSEPSKSNTGSSSLSHKKKDENTQKILKANRKIYHLGMYNNIVNMIWNPHPVKFYINESAICERGKTTRKIIRVYDPNLIMIQQRYKKGSKGGQKYFYALVKRAHLSEDKTIIVMTSVNMKDQDSSNEKHKNTIIENANLFKTSIESEEDIKQGKLKKVVVNIAGYLIEKIKKDIHITYIESINEDNST